MSDTSRGETVEVQPTITDWLKVEHRHQYSGSKFDAKEEADLLRTEGLGVNDTGRKSWSLFLGTYVKRFQQKAPVDYTLDGYLSASRSLLKEVSTTRGLILSLGILGGANVETANQASYAALNTEPADVIDYDVLYEPDFWNSSLGLRLKRVDRLVLKFASEGDQNDLEEAQDTTKSVLLDESMLVEGYMVRHGNIFPVPGVSSSVDPEVWRPSLEEIEQVRAGSLALN